MQQDSGDPTGVRADGKDAGIVRARERKANAAVQLRIAGASWDEVAEVVGYPSAIAAVRATEVALERELQTEGSQAKMRVLAGRRLDRLLRSVWSKAIDPTHPEHLLAVSKARDIVDRHARLYGLDAPTEVVVHTPTAQEIESWVTQVVGAGTPQLEEGDIFGETIEGEVVDD